ncbi:MAG: hypothetical protein ACI80V_002907 [Rhodothermales bacterium]|jgi:hypothetical protein
MRSSILVLATILAGALIAFMAGPQTAAEAGQAREVPSSTVQTRPLRFLMVGLGQDMSRLSDGLWHEDFQMIEAAARGIAEHPRITPPEVAAIKAALGGGFEQFVAIDGMVHDTATELAEAAVERNQGRVMELQGKLMQACVACHSGYREDVRQALY